jgi:transcriptional regulator with XRE-family HTH domain
MEHSYDTAGSKDSAEETPRAEWSTRITRLTAIRIRVWRERRGLSAQQLSDKSAELGYRVPRSVIANLENERRHFIGLAEVLILAAALDVPPVLLITAVGEQDHIELLPGLETTAWRGRGWLLGARHLPYSTFSLADWDESRRAIVLYDIHRLLVREYQQIQHRIGRLSEQDIPTSDEVEAMETLYRRRRAALSNAIRDLVDSIDRLRAHRGLIQAEGYLLPELSPAIATMVRAAGRDGDDEVSTRSHDALTAVLHEMVRTILPDPPS